MTRQEEELAIRQRELMARRREARMARQRTEPIMILFIGLLAVAAVAGVNLIINQKDDKTGRPAHASPVKVQDSAPRPREEQGAERAFMQRLSVVESLAKDLQQRVQKLETAPQFKRISSPEVSEANPRQGEVAERHLGMVDEALSHGQEYVAKGKYDPDGHAQILSALVKAYAVRNLSPTTNRSLMAAIQQVNEIGVRYYLTAARGLPGSDAVQLLDRFLRSTPGLTLAQAQEVRDAIRDIKSSR